MTDQAAGAALAGETRFASTPAESGARAAWLAELRATFALSWPLVLSGFGQVAMTATDVAMIGRLGAAPLAAAALAATLHFSFFVVGTGVLGAVAALLARELGARRHAVREVRRTVRQGLWSAVLLAVPTWALLWNAEPLLVALGQDAALAAAAGAYLRALQWSLLPLWVFVVFRSFVSALQRPGWALAITLGAVALNALLAWMLIFGRLGMPALGAVGAGVATTLVSVAMAAAFALVLVSDRRFRRYRLFGRFWRPDWPRFRSLWRLGVPLALTLLFETGIFSGAVFLMGLLGQTALAAHQIAVQLASLAFMVPLGVGQAVTVRVGRAWGANDEGGVRRAALVALGLGLGFMALTGLAMVVAPGPLIGLFVDRAAPANAELVSLAVSLLAVAALFALADGAQAVAIGMLRGVQDTRVPMGLALFGYWGVGMPLGVALAFPLGWGGVGVWCGLAAGLTVTAILLLRRWSRIRPRAEPARGGPL